MEMPRTKSRSDIRGLTAVEDLPQNFDNTIDHAGPIGELEGKLDDVDLSYISEERDQIRASKILLTISNETQEFVERLANGMQDNGSIKMIEESIARDSIVRTFNDVRAEAYQTAANRAYEYSSMLQQAQSTLKEEHQRTILKCLEMLMSQFGNTMEDLKNQTKNKK